MAICLDFDWQTNEFMVYCYIPPVVGFLMVSHTKRKEEIEKMKREW